MPLAEKPGLGIHQQGAGLTMNGLRPRRAVAAVATTAAVTVAGLAAPVSAGADGGWPGLYPVAAVAAANDLGAATGSLTTVRTDGATGVYRTYERGTVFGSPHGTFAVKDVLRAALAQSGGQPVHGWPVAAQSFLSRCGEWVQPFSRRTLYQDARWCPAEQYVQPSLTGHPQGNGYTLSAGFNGTAVHVVQRAIGMADQRPMATSMGPVTMSTLHAWQRRHGYPQTSSVDPTVWSRLRTPYPFRISSWAQQPTVATSATPGQRRAAIVAYAKSALNQSYLWGGTGYGSSTFGFDCSGLVLQAMRAGGVNPKRVSNYHDVYKASDLSNKMLNDAEFQRVPLSTASLLPGDMVFYGTSSGVAKHVGVYVGSGKVISAVTPTVRYSSVWETYGHAAVLAAIRPVSTTGSAASTTTSSTSVPMRPMVRRADPRLYLADRPYSPAVVTPSGALTLPERSASSGVLARVPAGRAVSLRAPQGAVAVWFGGDFVRAVTPAAGRRIAPSGTTDVLLVDRATVPNVGPDTPVSR